MKLFNKKSLILLISVVSINLLCIISVSYAYFTAQIKGNEDAKEMTVHAGTMTITYADTNEVSLNNAIPGDSVTKTFKVENTGTLDAKYNIKIDVNTNEFEDKKDLIYTLSKNGSEVIINQILPYEDGYIVIQNEIESGAVDNYSLKITFKNDLEITNQNDNANRKVDFTIVVDNEENVSLYEYKEPIRTFSEIIQVDNVKIFDDDPGENLRYVGANPDNYIWFNCDDYDNLTQETAESNGCEKWRIIGLFNSINKTAGGTENLIKIIRADKLDNISWDSSKTNNWKDASLQTSLTSYYNGTKLGSGEGIKDSTRDMVEQVTWNIGGTGDPRATFKATDWYTVERGSTVPSDAQATWDGYVGLMYPSDYGYATSGGGATDRDACLANRLYYWDTRPYKTNCAGNDWLWDSTWSQWTLIPYSVDSESVFPVTAAGFVGNWHSAALLELGVRPTLYLKSNVKTAGGHGSSIEPYILMQEPSE